MTDPKRNKKHFSNGTGDLGLWEEMQQNIKPQFNQALDIKQYCRIIQVREHNIHNVSFKVIQQLMNAVCSGSKEGVRAYIDGEGQILFAYLKSIDLQECRFMIHTLAYQALYYVIESKVPELKAHSIVCAHLETMMDQQENIKLIYIFINLLLRLTKQVYQYNKHGQLTKEVLEAVNYLEYHTHEKVAVQDVASRIHLSSRQLNRRFQTEMGCSVKGYINMERIEEAKYMLCLTSMSISQISNCLSYSSQSYFNKVFKKSTGVSPAQFRMKYVLVQPPACIILLIFITLLAFLY